jgi:hypothetical protein
MRKNFSLMFFFGLILLAFISCSTKQKVAEIPAGANKAAVTAPKPKPKVATKPSFTDNAGRSTLVGGQSESGSAITKPVPVATPAPKPVATPVPKPTVVTAPTPKPIAPKPDVDKPIAPKAVAATVERKPIKTKTENFDIAVGESKSSSFKYKYHVVVGSFKEKSNAVALHTALLKDGEKGSVVVVNEQEMYRVILGSFDEYKEAHARISRMGDRFIDAWVLVQAK